MFKIMFIPPVYQRRGKPVQVKPYVLTWKATKEEAVKYAIDATDRFAKRPGLVRVVPVEQHAA